MASIPTESRMSPSEIPSLRRSSADSPECDVVEGRVTNVSTPPRLGATAGNRAARMNDSAPSTPSCNSKLIIPPNPSKSLRARS